MNNLLKILLNRLKTVGIDYLFEVLIGTVSEYRRARKMGAFDTFQNKDTSDSETDFEEEFLNPEHRKSKFN